eukprot:UN06825
MNESQGNDSDDSDMQFNNNHNHNHNNNTNAVEYTQLLYQLQKIGDFTYPFIARSGLDTLRWILDVNDYVQANTGAPEELLFDKIIDTIPTHVQRYYRNV